MTFWTYAKKSYRWRIRRRINLDFNERKYGLESQGRNHFIKDFYFRMCRTTNVARYFGIFISIPLFKLYLKWKEDPTQKAREEMEMKKADDYVKNNIPTDPVLGNPEISSENLVHLVSSNYGFDSMIELISMNKKSNEFWESMCYKIDEENDGEKWHDYID
ncbi:hypothetical protein SteCoe_26582 [Stentor coeruleus]|uniref:Uncharacterized protein n=1 Tax=Stentor coeruleus TaxID=5963 RepID=A0A1R2BCH7_9CILI|nr:hypothetical protein SteCoe_26582 [Stentor coeruleus]